MSKLDELLKAWSGWQPKDPPHIFPGDEDAIKELDNGKRRTARCERTSVVRSWKEYHGDPEFGAPDDTRLHLGLFPSPFSGNLRTAKVFVLMLNPGCVPNDYFGQYERPEFKAALLRNLSQERVTGLMGLDPQFAWSAGFHYWNKKLSDLIRALKDDRRTFAGARAYLASAIASIELMPYHSPKFGVPRRYLNKMRSVQLVRDFVQNELVPQARKGKCLVILTRKAKSGAYRRPRTSSSTTEVKHGLHT
jgi:hypothetical protein